MTLQVSLVWDFSIAGWVDAVGSGTASKKRSLASGILFSHQQHSWPLKTSQTLLNASLLLLKNRATTWCCQRRICVTRSHKITLLSLNREFGIKPWWHWKIGFLTDSSYNSGSLIEMSQIWQVGNRVTVWKRITLTNAKLNITNKTY